MKSIKEIIVTVLFFLPVFIGWFLLFKLSAYRRDGSGLAGMFLTSNIRALRPDLYTDEGQHLLRWIWVLLLLMVPWFLVFVLLFK